MMSPQPEPTVPSSTMSAFLRARRPAILGEWEQAVRSLAITRALSEPRLLDHLPELLDRIATLLGEPTEGGLLGLPETHALERLDEGFDLGEVTAEYSMLRRCVLELYEREAPQAPLAEVRRFDAAIDEAIIASVARFTQARARTLIALDRISAAALDSGDVDTFLPRLLTVLMETTAAVDSVVILLREGARLKVRAATGFLEARDEDFPPGGGEGFAGTIAASRQPLLLRSAAEDPRVRSSFGRGAEARALYGVPMMLGDEVIGVAHIGSRTAHEFSDEDMLLFRTMVGRASALIGQARLHAEVRRRAAELEAVIESIQEGVYIGNAAGITQVNTAGVRMLGYDRPEELYRSVSALTAEIETRHVDTGERLTEEEEVFVQALRGRAVVRDVQMAHLKTGERRILRTAASPIVLDGQVHGVVTVNTDVTDQRRAEAERATLLARAQAARAEAEATLSLLDAFLSAAPLGVVFLDRSLRCVRLNEVLAELDGQPVPAHLGRTLTEVLGERAAPLEQALREVLETGRPVLNAELSGWGPPDGGARTHLANYFPVRARDGAVMGVGGAVLDITERKRAEEALEGQRLLYQSLLKAQSDMDEGVALVVGERLVYANEALERLTGLSEDELLGSSQYLELVTPEARAGFQAQLRQRSQGDTAPEHYEIPIVRGDGRRVELEVSSKPLGDGRRIAVFRDITERKAAQQERERLLAELEAARRQLAAILESLPLGILVAEAPGGRITLSNRNMEAILRHPVRPLASIGEFAAYGGRFRADGQPYAPEELPLARAVALGETVRSEEMACIRGDGARICIAVSAAPIRDAEGAIIAAVATFEDITERARAREEVAQALVFREQVMGILGHDLRTPLSAVRTAAGLLLRHGSLPEVAARSVRRIDRAAARMGEMIEALLDFTHARYKGELPVTRAPGDLIAVVEDALGELELAYPERVLRLRTSGDGRGLWDAGRLTQVVSNLVSNALHHGDAGAPVEVTVRGEGPEVVLAVSNAGPPIPEELRRCLFEPFRQGPAATGAGAHKGLGLGLYIVQQIVLAHGGSIDVDSTREGTTFTVRLPRAPPAHQGARGE